MKIRILDSHTGGEPTRVILDGGPDIGAGSLAARLARLRADHDPFRSAVINEPRFSGVGVGALLVPRITGSAYITGETILNLDERDPFRWGIPYSSGVL